MSRIVAHAVRLFIIPSLMCDNSACHSPTMDAWVPPGAVYIHAVAPAIASGERISDFPPILSPPPVLTIPTAGRPESYRVLYPGTVTVEQLVRHYQQVTPRSPRIVTGSPECSPTACRQVVSYIYEGNMQDVYIYVGSHREYTYATVSTYSISDADHNAFLKFCDGIERLVPLNR